MDEVRAFAPTGVIGSSYLETSLVRAMEWEPHFIGSDAGSTDHGPDALGRGKCMFPRQTVKRDMKLMLQAARSTNIPLLIGSSGTAGADLNLEWTADVLQEIAHEEGLHFRLALIHAEQDKEYLKKKLRQGRIHPLNPAPTISEEVIDRASHIVGMMGTEPYLRALDEGADVVLAGRSSDTEIGWEKRTPKSDKIERRRCQYERCPSRKIHEGIPPGSSEAGNGREAIIAGGSPPVVPGAIDVRVLGEGTKGRQTGRCRQDVQALD